MLALNSLKIFGNIKQRLDDENVGYTGFENVLSIANPSDANMKNLSSKLLQWKHVLQFTSQHQTTFTVNHRYHEMLIQ